MESNIIQIGNSNGVILPAKLLRQTGMDRQTKVSIIANMDEKAIIIKPSLRQGWASAAKRQHAEGGDSMLNPDILEDDIKDTEW